METLRYVSLLVPIYAVPAGFCVLGWLFCWNLSKKLRTLREQSEEQMESLKEQSEKQMQSLMEQGRKEMQSLEEYIRGLHEQIGELTEENERVAREEWFKDIVKSSYRNEIEVEVKLILPLVKFLGYHERDLKLRVPMDFQIGTQTIRGEADWVLWDSETDPTNPSGVIEAKAPTQDLHQGAQAQARSYAFGLNAPTYAITNGRKLQIFRRGIQSDTCVVDCAVTELAASWPAIYQAMAKDRTTGQDEG